MGEAEERFDVFEAGVRPAEISSSDYEYFFYIPKSLEVLACGWAVRDHG